MESLFYIDFSSNTLTGEIPLAITKLKSLIHLNCTGSQMIDSSGIHVYVKRNKSSSDLPYNQVSRSSPLWICSPLSYPSISCPPTPVHQLLSIHLSHIDLIPTNLLSASFMYTRSLSTNLMSSNHHPTLSSMPIQFMHHMFPLLTMTEMMVRTTAGSTIAMARKSNHSEDDASDGQICGYNGEISKGNS
ncbi:hypothetical protein Bca52824_004289 [Brassica carinata]|uniref:Uncharacterized protein n=1 Tax=Brassica carinata TaxID=52824 RepID=A0A8X7WNV3_BRACI|nr:hypothetical protein Bca52824_004289 [Brassica carinata]